MLDRNEDMMSTGGRHPFLAKYKVSCVTVVHVIVCFTRKRIKFSTARIKWLKHCLISSSCMFVCRLASLLMVECQHWRLTSMLMVGDQTTSLYL